MNQYTSAWCNPKELVVDADPFEAFECKFNPLGLDQDDFDELADIDDAAESESIVGRATIVVMSSADLLIAARLRLKLDRELHFAHIGDIVKLRKREAQRTIA